MACAMSLVKEAVDKQNLNGAGDPNSGLSRPSIVLRDAIVRANKIIYQTAKTQPQCEGMLQSLTSDRDLRQTLDAVAGVLKRGGLFAIDLVPDLPRWAEYDRRVSLSGRRGQGQVRLTESVRQDRAKGLTIFDQEYSERRGGRLTSTNRFSLTFRTITVPQMRQRLERAGFRIDALLGDYDGGPLDLRADVWIILARRSR